jgi:DNA primase large subunit
MVAYGDCVDQDALCDRIGHPLEYYERRLDGADPEALDADI